MTFTHIEASASLGAYALDALDDDEAVLLEAHLAECAPCTEELASLRHAAGWLGADLAEEPPVPLRSRVLPGIATIDRPPLAPPLAAYVAETTRLEGLLEDVDDTDWQIPTAAEGWGPKQLVAHLLATDSLVTARLGAPGVVPETEGDLLERTVVVQARHASMTVAETITEWRQSRNVLVHTAARSSLDAPMHWFGLDTTLAGMLVIRAFETWTHADDMRAATGRPLDPPGPAALGLMTDLLCQAMPIALQVRGLDPLPAVARIVLDGPGGGSWDVALGGAAATDGPSVVLRTDAVSWCRLGADRLDPADVPTVVEGDEALADMLLAAASAFAVP